MPKKRTKARRRLRSEQWYRGCEQTKTIPKRIKPPIPAFYLSKAWRTLRKQIMERDQHLCQYCGATAQTVDHIIPRKKGGPDSDENLVACCHPCNGTAGGRTFASFNKKKTYVMAYRILKTASTPNGHLTEADPSV